LEKKSQEELITQLKQLAFVMISKSGGARMMEAAYSLMQLAKHLKLAQLTKQNFLTFHYVQILQLEVQLPLTRC
jgi:acetyl-CoA carboxylase beta subunit